MLTRTSNPESDVQLHTWSVWWLVFVAFVLMYVLTSQESVSWQDSGMFQWRVLTGDYEGDLGLALAHPLYIQAARLLMYISSDNIISHINSFSGLGMAVALANLALLVTMMTGRKWIGLTVSGMLGVSHMVWWLSTIAEVYTWSVAGLTGELLALFYLLRRPKWQTLATLAFVSGLGLSIHNLALLPLPVYIGTAAILLYRHRLPPWSLIIAAVAYLLGAASFITMIVGVAARSGDITGTIYSALLGGDRFASATLGTRIDLEYFKVNAALFCLNFTNPLWLFAVVGLLDLRKHPNRVLSTTIYAITVIELLFFIRYFVPDQATFALPSLVMLAIAAAMGIKATVHRIPHAKSAILVTGVLFVVLTPLFYTATLRLLRARGLEVRRSRTLPFRDEMRYWLIPWKHDERSAEQFATAALSQASPDGVIFADGTSLHPLRLIKSLKNKSPNVELYIYKVSAEEMRNILGTAAERPLYVVSPVPRYAPPALLEAYCFEHDGVLFKVKKCENDDQ